MKTLIASLLLLAGLFGAGQASAAIDVYTFDSDAQEQTFRELTKGCAAPSARTRTSRTPTPGSPRICRDKTYQMVREAGRSRKWWTTWWPATATSSPMIPLMASTLILWLGPLLVIVIGVVTLVVHQPPPRPPTLQQPEGALSAEEQARLAALLKEEEKP